MSRQANETKPIKHICAGLLAHVDAEKRPWLKVFCTAAALSAVWDGWITEMLFWIRMP